VLENITSHFNRPRHLHNCIFRKASLLHASVTSLVKVKFTLEQTMKAQRGSRGIGLLFNLGAGWGWVVNATPRPLYPREWPGTHCTGGWVGLSGRVLKISPPPGFDPRTVQPVASRYTDYAILAPSRIFGRPDRLVLQEGRLYRLFPYSWYFVWYPHMYNFLGFYFVDTYKIENDVH
jgi:hypothetical protein